MNKRSGASRRPVMDRRTQLAAAGADIIVVVTPDENRAHTLTRSVEFLGAIAVHLTNADQSAVVVSRFLVRWVLVDLGTDRARKLIQRLRADRVHVVCIGGTASDRVWALEMGCLDALGTTDPDEIEVRLQTLIARRPQAMQASALEVGALRVDVGAGTVSWAGRQSRPQPLIVKLAAYLAARPGELIPIQTLLSDVWGEPWAEPHRLHMAILRLKRCLGSGASIVVSQRRFGYGLDPRKAS